MAYLPKNKEDLTDRQRSKLVMFLARQERDKRLAKASQTPKPSASPKPPSKPAQSDSDS